MKLKKLAERVYRAYRGVDVVNCSTCPHWVFHSQRPGHRESRVIQEGQTFKLQRLNNDVEPPPERWGVCMQARILPVPLVGLGNCVRCTMAGDVCAKHPHYVAPKVVHGPDFKPGVGKVAGFDKVPTLREAMAYARLRANHLPDLENLTKYGEDMNNAADKARNKAPPKPDNAT